MSMWQVEMGPIIRSCLYDIFADLINRFSLSQEICFFNTRGHGHRSRLLLRLAIDILCLARFIHLLWSVFANLNDLHTNNSQAVVFQIYTVIGMSSTILCAAFCLYLYYVRFYCSNTWTTVDEMVRLNFQDFYRSNHREIRSALETNHQSRSTILVSVWLKKLSLLAAFVFNLYRHGSIGTTASNNPSPVVFQQRFVHFPLQSSIIRVRVILIWLFAEVFNVLLFILGIC